jgi:hypothetical protein
VLPNFDYQGIDRYRIGSVSYRRWVYDATEGRAEMGVGTTSNLDRTTVKIDPDRRDRLKMAAAARRVTMIDLLAEAVDAYLADEPPASRRKRPRERDAISA